MAHHTSIVLPTVLLLFPALAGAQSGGGSLTCNATTGVTPIMRAESYTELTGDILITCAGGDAIAPGAAIPQINIAVFLNTTVTSRLLPSGFSPGVSEALLMIDEPGSQSFFRPVVPGYGAEAPQILCPTPTMGCEEYAVAKSGSVSKIHTVASGSPDGSTGPGANVFQGIVSGNQVVFYGVPFLPPTNGSIRVFRITNIRANAAALGPGFTIPAAVVATMSVSGSIAPPISNQILTVGYDMRSLNFQVRTVDNAQILDNAAFPPCPLGTICPFATLRFQGGFPTAFKTRVAPLADSAYAGQAQNLTGQNLPGYIFNTESGFIASYATGTNGATAGLTDYGTRVKAVISNIPAGVNVYVPLYNAPPPAVPGGTATSPFAALVTGETATDGTGQFPAVPGTFTYGGLPAVQLSVVNGSAMAVWEIVNATSYTLSTFDFPLLVSYAGGVTPSGSLTIAGSLAPNPDQGAFDASLAHSASSDLPVPRFASLGSFSTTGISLSPNQALNTGPVSVTISGISGFVTGAEFAGPGVPGIFGSVSGGSGSMLSLTFDLTSALPGIRDLLLYGSTWPPVRLTGAFQVVAPSACAYTLSPTAQSFNTAGGKGQALVTATPAQCTWTASADTGWIRLLPTTGGTILNYSVAANPDASQRTGHIFAAGLTLTVTQAGLATCLYSINPPSQVFPVGGANGNIAVKTQANCSWSVTNPLGWVNLTTGTSGSGPGSVGFTVFPNPGGPRSGTLVVAGLPFGVSQSASACGATDITSQVSVKLSGFSSVPPLFNSFVQTVTLTNQGASVAGPIYLVMDGLPRTGSPCTAKNTPNTTCNVSPAPPLTYCQSPSGSDLVLMSSGGLASGASVTRTLSFSPGPAAGGGTAGLQYTPRVLSGTPAQ